MVEVRFVPEFEDGQNLQKLHKPEGKGCVNALHKREAWAGY